MRPAACQDSIALSSPLPGIARHGLFLLGGASFVTGAVGLVLPVLPTTVFWIIAAWAWSKSCPRLQRKLYTLPVAGPHVRAWIEEGRISRRGKHFALGGLAFGMLASALVLADQPLVLGLASLPQLAVAAFLATRPTGEV